MKTLLLTGGTGYIGSHNAIVFLEAGYEVILLDNLTNSSQDVVGAIEKITGKQIKFYKGDIRKVEDIELVFNENNIDGVVHFAGLKAVGESCEKPLEYYENNIIGTKNLLSVMEKYNCKNIIFSSTATVYSPEAPIPYSEETQTGNTTNPYATSKFIIENMLRDFSQHKDFCTTSLRYFNPIGAHASGFIGEDPNDIPNNLLPFIMKVMSGELPKLYIFGDDYDTRDGTGIRDYIHVMDLAYGHLAALEKIKKGFHCFNLGLGKGTSVKEVMCIAEKITKKSIPHQVTPRRLGDIGEFYCNPSKAYKELGWKAEKTVEEAITDSWNFICRSRKDR